MWLCGVTLAWIGYAFAVHHVGLKSTQSAVISSM